MNPSSLLKQFLGHTPKHFGSLQCIHANEKYSIFSPSSIVNTCLKSSPLSILLSFWSIHASKHAPHAVHNSLLNLNKLFIISLHLSIHFFNLTLTTSIRRESTIRVKIITNNTIYISFSISMIHMYILI